MFIPRFVDPILTETQFECCSLDRIDDLHFGQPVRMMFGLLAESSVLFVSGAWKFLADLVVVCNT